MSVRNCAAGAVLLVLSATPAIAQRGTRADITTGDLRARMSIFADDSMGGRGTGSEGHQKAVRYLAAELERMGVQPAGDSGTYFQSVPLFQRAFDSSSTVRLEGRTLIAGRDYQPRDAGSGGRSFRGAQLIFAGTWPDTAAMVSPAQTAGKVVVILPPGNTPAQSSVIRIPVVQRYSNAAAIVIANLDILPPATLGFFQGITPAALRLTNAVSELPSYLHVPRAMIQEMFGMDAAVIRPGQTGRTMDGEIRYRDIAVRALNVAGVVPGRDPALRGQYVAIGAHSDAIGMVDAAEHDSVRNWMGQVLALQERGLSGQALFQAAQQIRVNVDSLRRLRPARRDSIVNGADDDASGSVGVLEMAEHFVRRPARRSMLFVWHVGEEQGLFGSDWFTRHPTVARDSIVAQLNVDMIGRGTAGDLREGGSGYLQLIGTRRLSTELGNLVETANAARRQPFVFDYQYDAAGHPENFYCRSDHYMYARYGIPIAFFTTGGHRDYHQISDEIAYIDFAKLQAVTELVADIGRRLGDAPSRPVVDGQRAASIDAPCQQ